ncbi:glycosyltransferase family 2 protein [Aerosticca soli]|uniref:glycosyltransferase family 2 protein n=1 Tax=Aerosticca soli TaxID=2010829 RepID=UPI000F846554|nr:glycosyltransferase [Aerosticca soli]
MRDLLHASWQRWRYGRWRSLYRQQTERDLQRLARAVEQLPWQPRISVVVPIFNPQSDHLVAMIESVRRQVYARWELCLVDDASDARHVREILRRYADLDERILRVSRPVNGHICAASNSGLALASGEYLALLDHDDLLAPHALAMVVKYLNRHPQTRLLYSDEDKVSVSGSFHSPHFKPDWDPELILQTNYFSHLGVFETDLVREVGGFREGLEGSQDHDLVLRCVRRAGEQAVTHIPHVLYHWRTTPQSTAGAADRKPYAPAAGLTAVGEHLAALGRAATVRPARAGFPFMSLEYPLPAPAPPVLVLIDAYEDEKELAACALHLLERTAYPRYRIVGLGRHGCRTRLPAPGRVDFFEVNGRVALAAMMNEAVARSDEAFVCLLDTRTRVGEPNWLARLVSHAAIGETGLAGARLCGPRGRIIAAGMVGTGSGDAVMARPGRKAEGLGYFGLNRLTRQVTFLPGLGVVASRSAFLQAGGIPEHADGWIARGLGLSARMNDRGLRNLLVGASTLTLLGHPRGRVAKPQGRAACASTADRFYNPNLALDARDASFRLGFPPGSARSTSRGPAACRVVRGGIGVHRAHHGDGQPAVSRSRSSRVCRDMHSTTRPEPVRDS